MCARDGRSVPPVPSSSFQLPAFIWSSDCDIVATITSGSDAHQRTNMEASIFALCTANAPLKLRTNWAYRMVIPILFYAPTRPRCLGGPSPPKIVWKMLSQSLWYGGEISCEPACAIYTTGRLVCLIKLLTKINVCYKICYVVRKCLCIKQTVQAVDMSMCGLLPQERQSESCISKASRSGRLFMANFVGH